jgi:hypothetical protein
MEATGIVAWKGPTRLSAAIGGVKTTCLSDFEAEVEAASGFTVGLFELCFGGWFAPKPEFDDWRRVLTTSRGHVTMAPIVPPILQSDDKHDLEVIKNFCITKFNLPSSHQVDNGVRHHFLCLDNDDGLGLCCPMLDCTQDVGLGNMASWHSVFTTIFCLFFMTPGMQCSWKTLLRSSCFRSLFFRG